MSESESSEAYRAGVARFEAVSKSRVSGVMKRGREEEAYMVVRFLFVVSSAVA